MADLVITDANVKVKSIDAALLVVQVGEVVGRSQPLRLDASDSRYYLSDANVDVATAAANGISLTGAALDGFVVLVTDGSLDLGATLIVGDVYVVSATSGKIAPIGDLVSTQFTSILGHATDANTLKIDFNATGTAKA